MTAPIAVAAAKKAAGGSAARTAAGSGAVAKGKAGARRGPLTGTFGDEDDPFGPPTKADAAAMKSQARSRDKAYAEEHQDDDPSPRGRRNASSSSSSRSAKPFRPANLARGRSAVPGGSPTEEGAGFLLGLFMYALLVNFLRAGPDGVRAWLRAKFFNQPSAVAAAPAPTAHASGQAVAGAVVDRLKAVR